MNNLQHPVFEQLFSVFSEVQRSARTLKDLEYGIGKYTPLLRVASHILNGTSFDSATLLQAPPLLFILRGELEISNDFTHKPFVDMYMSRYQVHTKLVYCPESGLDLKLVFNNLPELGVFFESMTAPSYAGEPTASRLVFSPAKWPMIASFLISKVCNDETLGYDSISQVMLDYYPGLPQDMVREFVRSGLFTDPVELCDFLVDNATASPVHAGTLVIPNDL